MTATESRGNAELQESAEPQDIAQPEDADRFSIVRVPERSQYDLLDGATRIGFAKYRESPGSVTFTHTVVDSSYGGMGLGSRLARHVLDDARGSGLRIIPVCPFIAAYLHKHHDYDANVDWPVADAGA